MACFLLEIELDGSEHYSYVSSVQSVRKRCEVVNLGTSHASAAGRIRVGVLCIVKKKEERKSLAAALARHFYLDTLQRRFERRNMNEDASCAANSQTSHDGVKTDVARARWTLLRQVTAPFQNV